MEFSAISIGVDIRKFSNRSPLISFPVFVKVWNECLEIENSNLRQKNG